MTTVLTLDIHFRYSHTMVIEFNRNVDVEEMTCILYDLLYEEHKEMECDWRLDSEVEVYGIDPTIFTRYQEEFEKNVLEEVE